MFLRSKPMAATALAVLVVLGGGIAACGDDDDGATVRESGPGVSGSGSGSASGTGSGSGSGSASGTEGQECVLVGNSEETATGVVEISLNEFTIGAEPTTIPAGTIEFVATNAGVEIHELVIARFDGEPTALPTDADGAADEAQLPPDAVIGEIEGFAGDGMSCPGKFDLTAGNYVLFCNIVEEEEQEAHYDMGMTTTFTVT